MPYPKGGEPVALLNLTPDGQRAFDLPVVPMPVEFVNVNYERIEHDAVIDTIMIEPDLQRFTLVWRASVPLKRNMLEMRQVLAGRMPRGWYRARDKRKSFLPSLAMLTQEKTPVEDESAE